MRSILKLGGKDMRFSMKMMFAAGFKYFAAACRVVYTMKLSSTDGFSVQIFTLPLSVIV